MSAPVPWHGALWRFRGDPDLLATAYDVSLAEMGRGGLLHQVCLRLPDGILLVDVCPSRRAFEDFRSSPELAAGLRRHGLPDPRVDDHPVHAAFFRGARVDPCG